MKKIDFYFDFLSPYSYFAWKNHKKISEQFNYKPVLMGKLFSHFEFRGPGEIPVKRDSELKKCFRYADLHNLDFTPPPSFPFNPLGIIRLATRSASGAKQAQVIDLIFKTVWGEGTILEDPERIEELLQTNGLEDIFEKSFSKESKLELKANIKEAIQLKIFGVPTFKVNDEVFWGNDSIELMTHHLDGNDNWDRKLYDVLREK